jgi:adenine specific DNA methylase Mod
MLHSLLQFSPSEVMQFQILYIEFDFDDEDEMDAYDKDRLTSEIIGEIWEADDEDDLVEEITCATGWCIKSIDYRHILK